LPGQKAGYFRRNEAAFTYLLGRELADRHRSRAFDLCKVGFDCCVRLNETSLSSYKPRASKGFWVTAA
jgi:hypothetical protein